MKKQPATRNEDVASKLVQMTVAEDLYLQKYLPDSKMDEDYERDTSVIGNSERPNIK